MNSMGCRDIMVFATPRRRTLTNLKNLVEIYEAGGFTLWEYNRVIDESRAQVVATHCVTHGHNMGPLPIVIACLPPPSHEAMCDVGCDARAFLVDGQHRLRAGAIMGRDAAALVEVEVIYEECTDDGAVMELFSLINRGTPVPARYHDKLLREFTAEVGPLIKLQWPLAFSTTKGNPKRPNFNDTSIADQLDNKLCSQGLLDGTITPTVYVGLLIRLCDRVKDEYEADPNAAALKYTAPIDGVIYKTAEIKKFYAGIEKKWGKAAAGLVTQAQARPMEIDEERS